MFRWMRFHRRVHHMISIPSLIGEITIYLSIYLYSILIFYSGQVFLPCLSTISQTMFIPFSFPHPGLFFLIEIIVRFFTWLSSLSSLRSALRCSFHKLAISVLSSKELSGQQIVCGQIVILEQLMVVIETVQMISESPSTGEAFRY